jgi:hypothetical protein
MRHLTLYLQVLSELSYNLLFLDTEDRANELFSYIATGGM